MRRSDKKQNIQLANMLLETRQMGVTEKEIAEYLLEGLPRTVLNEQEQLNEALGLVGIIKTFMTSEKVGEFLTYLAKWVLKITGLGSEKKCDEVSCAEAAVAKVQKKLHDIHHWIEEKVNYIAAMIKFRKLKPSKEQVEQSKVLGKALMTGIIATFLIMYIQAFGLAIAGGSIVKAVWPLIGTIAKAADLVQLKKQSEQEIKQNLTN